MKQLGILLALLLGVSTFAQQPLELTTAQRSTLDAYQDTIAMQSFLVLRDTSMEMRSAATRNLIKTLVRALKTENSFAYKFPLVKNISIQYPADSSFRVFTWQLFVDDNHYRYFGAIQKRSADLELYGLSDRSADLLYPETTPTGAKDWYGMLIYNIHQFDTPTGRRYLLFGFDGYEFFDKRKVVDVLTFGRDRRPRFGAYPTFQQLDPETNEPTDTLHRLVLDYNAEASIRVNFDPVTGALIHDFLKPTGNPYSGKLSGLPDGTFVGYFPTESGVWTQQRRMFNTTVDEPPRDFPVLGTEGTRERRDLFGRKN